MDVTIKVDPTMERLMKAFQNADPVNGMRDEIYKYAFKVERYAKQLTPVATGRLRASIATSVLIGNRIGAMVATNADYAVFVHEGTRYMRGRPFLTEGVKMANDNLAGILGARVDQEFADAFKRI